MRARADLAYQLHPAIARADHTHADAICGSQHFGWSGCQSPSESGGYLADKIAPGIHDLSVAGGNCLPPCKENFGRRAELLTMVSLIPISSVFVPPSNRVGGSLIHYPPLMFWLKNWCSL